MGCLKTAQVYEQKYFEQEDKVSKLTKDLYKKTKELNTTKRDIDKFVRQQSVNEHCENIKIGNVNAVNHIESNLYENKSAEEQAAHLKSVYDWILKENRKMLKENATNKKNHRFDMQQQREINEELRIRIEELQKMGHQHLVKRDSLKKRYFELKEKYLHRCERFKSLAEKYKVLKAKDLKIEKEAKVMPEIQNLSVIENEETADDGHSISYEENAENVNVQKEDLNEGRLQMNDDDDEDDDLQSDQSLNSQKVKVGSMNSGESIFSYPGSSRNGFQANTFRQQRPSANSLFGAYRQIKSNKDTNRRNNPFSKNINRKRNFTQFSKGDDGRGGTKTFLTDTTSNFRNNRNKRRRIVKSSSNQNKNNRKKASITNFFKKNR